MIRYPRVYRSSGSLFHRRVEEFKRQLITETLNITEGNRTQAARLLGLQRTYLMRLIRALNIDVPPTRDS